MKLQGISCLHSIREILTDNCRKSDINGITEKIRAKDFAITAFTPSALRTPGACSLEDPHPKFSPPTTKSPGLTFWKNPDPVIQMCGLHFIQIRQKQILGCNDLIGIKVIMKFKNCSLIHKTSSFLIVIHFRVNIPLLPSSSYILTQNVI